MILCNSGKIFHLSFFDAIDHLPIHLARKAALGDHVHYRWLYPYERYMFHFKKKVKILNNVEGSIVAHNINIKTSNIAE